MKRFVGLGMTFWFALVAGCAGGDDPHGSGAGGDGGGDATGSGAGHAGGGPASGTGSGAGGHGASSSSSTASGGGGPCGGKIGVFCGQSLGLDPDKLYDCNGSMATVATVCSGTCIVSQGGADACPCPAGDGVYCGARVGGDGGKLYDCHGGTLGEHATCVGACDAGSGASDGCAPCPSGDGAYCGSGIGHDPNTIYTCSGGQITEAQHCPSACQVNPPGQPDTCGGCPSGNGAYCGSEVGADPNTLYDCQNGSLTVTQACPSSCHVAPPGQPDYCESNGTLSCANVQWWNAGITYGPYQLQNGGYTWWDTDLAIGAGTPVQLRHDSQLVQAPVEPWGWQPQFIDMATGERFQFLHLRPQAQYTTAVGTVYPAGTVVGLSGGNTGDTGYPTYSTGAHLCVETIGSWTSVFPPGQDPCN